MEGTTRFETVRHAWFRCRITENPAPDANDAQGGQRRVARTAQLLCGIKDVDGGALVVKASDRLEVYSKQLGRHVYEVTSDGEPLRKKRRVIGWSATLVRVQEHEFEAAEP